MLKSSLWFLVIRTGLFKTFFRMMLDTRISIRSKIVVPMAIIYLLSPIDFIPDFVPFSGWMDDVVVVVASLTYFLYSVPKSVRSEYINLGRDHSHKDSRRSASRGKVIEGEYSVKGEKDADYD